MDINEKAKEYAEGKALNALTSAIEEAYASGYKDGYKDGNADREPPQSEVKYKELKYIDLDLPSGTKWAVGYLTKTNGSIELLPYDKAKVYNLPSKEQYLELLKNTEQRLVNKGTCYGTEFISIINGSRFFIPCGCYNMGGDSIYHTDNYRFWLKDTSFNRKSLSVEGAIIEATWDNFKLPVVLVSK